MVRSWCLGPLPFAAAVLADYYIDNANTSVVQYTAPPTQSGQIWQFFSTGTQTLALQFTNSTGNYTVVLDSSDCYDENYTLGDCTTSDNCYITIPFTGSGISMYVFNAGVSATAASFSVDGGPAFTNQTVTPPAPTYQQSRVLLYDIQGLPSGDHTMVMTVVDLDGAASSMKFDYAYVNETFVANSTSTSSVISSSSTLQGPSQTSSGSPNSPSSSIPSSSPNSKRSSLDLGAIIGGSLAGVTFLVAVVFGLFSFRNKRHQVSPFMPSSRSLNDPPPLLPTTTSSFQALNQSIYTTPFDPSPSVPPLVRSALLLEAHAASEYTAPEPSTLSQIRSSIILQPLRRPPSIAEVGSRFSDSTSDDDHYPHNLTTKQSETIERLRASGVPSEAIVRVIEGYRTSLGRDSGSGMMRSRSAMSVAPPPSYQTRAR